MAKELRAVEPPAAGQVDQSVDQQQRRHDYVVELLNSIVRPPNDVDYAGLYNFGALNPNHPESVACTIQPKGRTIDPALVHRLAVVEEKKYGILKYTLFRLEEYD